MCVIYMREDNEFNGNLVYVDYMDLAVCCPNTSFYSLSCVSSIYAIASYPNNICNIFDDINLCSATSNISEVLNIYRSM